MRRDSHWRANTSSDAVAGPTFLEALEPRLLLAGNTIGVDVVGLCYGGTPKDSNHPANGGDGGVIDIRTGIDVSVGDGKDGYLFGSKTLTSGTYNYYQVGHDYSSGAYAIITIDGDVTINCICLFSAEIRAVFHPGAAPPRLHVNAGPALTFAAEAPTVRHAIGFNLDPGDAVNPDGSGLDGATIEFWTSQGGDIVGDVSSVVGMDPFVSATGGSGVEGGEGGAGGSVTLIADDATVKIGSVMVGGGGGGDADDADVPGGRGGDGGQIILAGESLDTYDVPGLNADGGSGGWGRYADSKFAATEGGAGGDGGAIVSQVASLLSGSFEYCAANGGEGGHGGNGLDGEVFAGGSGTDGMAGGDGGVCGRIVGLGFGDTFGGEGGNGGWGGNGGVGSNGDISSQGGPGGDGGQGGDGGDSGGPGGAVGRGGYGGSGGAGGDGNPIGDAGWAGQDGIDGVVGGGASVPAPAVPSVTPSRTHFLTLGVNDSLSSHGGQLNATWLANAFAQLGCIRSASMLMMTTLDTGQRGKLEAAIADAEGRVRDDDTFIFYENSHGGYDANGDEVASPTSQGDNHTTGDEHLLLSRPTPAENITDDQLHAAFSSPTWDGVNKLFIMDCCYSGGYWGSTTRGDTGDFATLPRSALIAASPEDSGSWATKASNGQFAGVLGQALYYTLLDMKGSGAIDFENLCDRAMITGSYFTGLSGRIQDEDFTTDGVINFNMASSSRPDFQLALASSAFSVGQFGQVGGKAVKISARQSDGTMVTFSLSGPGVGEVTVGADGWDVSVTGTTAASTLTIAGKASGGSDAEVELHSITVGDVATPGDWTALKSLSAKTVNLSGNLTVTGSLGSLALGDVTAGDILIGAPQAGDKKTALAITLDVLADVNLTTRTPIKSVKATDWGNPTAGAETITAPWVGAITVTGRKADAKKGLAALAGDLNVGLSLAGGAGAALGKAAIAGGVLSQQWTIGGALTSLTLRGSLAGTLLRTTGSVKSLSLGACINSDILVGLASYPGRHASAASQFETLTGLGSLKITGWKVDPPVTFFAGSNVSAAAMGTVNLLNVDYTWAPEFGLWAGTEIKSVAALDQATKDRWTWTAAAPIALPAGNMVIRLL